jgi:hypothetical protein
LSLTQKLGERGRFAKVSELTLLKALKYPVMTVQYKLWFWIDTPLLYVKTSANAQPKK